MLDAEKQKSQRINDIYSTFSTEEGQRVLEWMQRKFHWYGITFTRNGSHESAFREGQRSVVGDILYCMELYKNPESLKKKVPEGENWVSV